MAHEWLYLRLPCDGGSFGSDRTLTGIVAPSARQLMERGLIDRYFFLRYLEGGLHVRYRVRVPDDAAVGDVVRCLESTTRSFSGRATADWAAYEPEVQKYGGLEGLAIAERHFTASSALALACIECTPRDRAVRLMVALQTARTLIELSTVDAVDRERMLIDYAGYWRAVHSALGGAPLGRQRPDDDIRRWLARSDGSLAQLTDRLAPKFASALAIWHGRMVVDLADLDRIRRGGRLATSRCAVISNFLHTFHNRLGLGVPQEVTIAEYLLEAGGGGPR